MKFSLGILVVVALLGANARIWNEENSVDQFPPRSDDVESASLMNYEDESQDEYVEDQNEDMTEMEMSEVKDLEENGSEDELVDMDNFDMSIFPKIEDVDPSEFIEEKDTNLTGRCGHCAMTYQKPSRGHKCSVSHTTWCYVLTHSKKIYPTVCHTGHGDIPGFQWKGRCYYTFAHRLYRTYIFSWVGVICGRAYYGKSHCCNVFGGYQRLFRRPLFLCVAKYRGWLIPGKYDQKTKLCGFLNKYTKCCRTVVAH